MQAELVVAARDRVAALMLSGAFAADERLVNHVHEPGEGSTEATCLVPEMLLLRFAGQDLATIATDVGMSVSMGCTRIRELATAMGVGAPRSHRGCKAKSKGMAS